MLRKKYGASMFMASIALIFLVLHVWSGWHAFVQDATSHHEDALWSEYLIVWIRDTVENLQSEFWQLAVQFALLAGFFRLIGIRAYEEDEEELKKHLDRLEAKLDTLMAELDKARR